MLIYRSADGSIKIDVRMGEETVWLTQDQMAALFGKAKSTINEHLKNIFSEGELVADSVIRNFRTTAADGKGYDTNYYNLDVIISVGYRVKSHQGTQFRIWATQVLREYLIKGFDYKNRNIRICFMGDRTALDPKLQKLMNELETDSASKTGLTVNIAVNYGGRPEIVRAAQSLAARAAAGELKPEDITEEALSAQMYTAGQKDPDFILRPSGEKRLSNFMLWQAAYSELVEMDVLWPDFMTSMPPSWSSTGAPAASADSESSNRYARCRAACAAPGERPVFPRALTLQTLPEQGSGSRTKQRRT